MGKAYTRISSLLARIGGKADLWRSTMKKALPAIACLLLIMTVSSCSAAVTGTNTPSETVPENTTTVTIAEPTGIETSIAETAPVTTTVLPTPTNKPTPAPQPTTKPTTKPTPTARPTSQPTPTVQPTTRPTPGPIDPERLSGHVVVLDPGHQTHANFELEPIAPGSTEMKIKTSSGTAGVATGRAEYIVNLEISLMLADYLEAQGCTVYLTRTTHDVDLSNMDRAVFANGKNPDAYLRIHCNGSATQSVHGVEIYVPASGACRDDAVVWGGWLAAELCEATGAKNRGVFSSSIYTGLNWAADIPSFLTEMGYMTNPEEDRLLSDPAYQMQLCEGFADFIERMPRRTAG